MGQAGWLEWLWVEVLASAHHSTMLQVHTSDEPWAERAWSQRSAVPSSHTNLDRDTALRQALLRILQSSKAPHLL